VRDYLIKEVRAQHRKRCAVRLSGKGLVTVFEFMIADLHGVVGHREHKVKGECSVGAHSSGRFAVMIR